MNKNQKKQNLSWIAHKLIVKKILANEFGVFAKKNIKKDDLLMIFGGHIMSRDEERNLPEKIRDAAIQIDKNFVIGAKNLNEISNTDYVNHSCKPNAYIQGQISLYALRDIKKNEEITFDYGTVLFGNKKNPTYKIHCYCNTKNCRNYITDHDWKMPEFQKKYKNKLPFYIVNEIKKLKNSI